MMHRNLGFYVASFLHFLLSIYTLKRLVCGVQLRITKSSKLSNTNFYNETTSKGHPYLRMLLSMSQVSNTSAL